MTDDEGATSAESVPANGESVDVRALDNTFIDEVIGVDAGTEVHWENRSRNDHDIVPVADNEAWGIDLEDFTPGDRTPTSFRRPAPIALSARFTGPPTSAWSAP